MACSRALLVVGTKSYALFASITDTEDLVGALETHRSVAPRGELASIDQLVKLLAAPRSDHARQDAIAVAEAFARRDHADRCIGRMPNVPPRH